MATVNVTLEFEVEDNASAEELNDVLTELSNKEGKKIIKKFGKKIEEFTSYKAEFVGVEITNF